MADETPPQEEPKGTTVVASNDLDPTKPQGPAEEVDWQKAARFHEKRNKEAFAELTTVKAKLEELKTASQSEQEKAIKKARKEGAKEATAEVTTGFQKRVLNAEIEAQAAGRFADPDDAVRLLDLDDADIFDGEGEVQTATLKRALDDLLERKPHLAAERQQTVGDADAGKGQGPVSGDMNDLIRQRVRG